VRDLEPSRDLGNLPCYEPCYKHCMHTPFAARTQLVYTTRNLHGWMQHTLNPQPSTLNPQP
jgi:hypothetical protein